jgi:hypothetical protein
LLNAGVTYENVPLDNVQLVKVFKSGEFEVLDSKFFNNEYAKGGKAKGKKGDIGKSGTQYGYTLKEWEKLAEKNGLLVSPSQWWKSQKGKKYKDSFGRNKIVGQHSGDEQQEMMRYGYMIANGMDLGSDKIPASAKKYVQDNNLSKYAKGGMTEHGLRIKDTILGDYGNDTIIVRNSMGDMERVNLDKGNRFAKGGGVDKKGKIEISEDEEGRKIARRIIVEKDDAGDVVTYNLEVGLFAGRKKGYFIVEGTWDEVMEEGTEDEYTEEQYFYQEGGLWIEGGKVTDYDGVYELEPKLRPLMSALNLNSQDVYAEGGVVKRKRRNKRQPKVTRIQFEEGNYEYAKGGGVDSKKYDKGGEIYDDTYTPVSKALKSKLRKKLGLQPNDDLDESNSQVYLLSYSDNDAGSLFDKVMIDYLEKNYPQDIVVEKTKNNGKDAFIFGDTADRYIEAVEDYGGMSFDDYAIDDDYFEILKEMELKEFNKYLDDLEAQEHIFDREEVLDWLMDMRGAGYYDPYPNRIEIDDKSKLRDDLEAEGLVKFTSFAKGGGVDKLAYPQILEIIRYLINDFKSEFYTQYEKVDFAKGKEVNPKSKDEFYKSTDGGYELVWYEDLINFAGQPLGALPSLALDNEKHNLVDKNYEEARQEFIRKNPELVKKVGGEEYVGAGNLTEQGYDDESDELVEMENNMLLGKFIKCTLAGYYFKPKNNGVDATHKILLVGSVNLDIPNHTRGKSEETYEVEIKFKSDTSDDDVHYALIEGLQDILSWFNGDFWENTTEKKTLDEFSEGGGVDSETTLYKVVAYNKGSDFRNGKNGIVLGDGYVTKSQAEDTMYFPKGEIYPFIEIIEYNGKDSYKKGGGVDEGIQFATIIKKDDKNYNKIGYSKLTEFIKDKQGNEFDKLYFEGKKLPTKYNVDDLNYSVRELDTFTSATGERKFILLKELTNDNRIYYYILHFDDKKVYAESYDMNFIKSEIKRLTNGKNFYSKAGVNFAEGGEAGELVNVSGEAFYVTETSAKDSGLNFNTLSDTFYESKDDFEDLLGRAILTFSFDVNVKNQWNIIQAIYDQMESEGLLENEGDVQIVGFELDRYPKNNFESQLPYDIEDEDEDYEDDEDEDEDDDYAGGGEAVKDNKGEKLSLGDLVKYKGATYIVGFDGLPCIIEVETPVEFESTTNYYKPIIKEPKEKIYFKDVPEIQGAIELIAKYYDVRIYAGGGQVEDWMEESLNELIEKTGFVDLEITMVSETGNEFVADTGIYDFRVFKTESDAEETAIAQVFEDLDEYPENFNRDWLMSYIDGGDFFAENIRLSSAEYVEELETLPDSKYDNLLIAELIENGLLDEEDAENIDYQELEELKGDFADLIAQDRINMGNNGLDYYLDELGEEDTFRIIIDNNLLDKVEASQDAVAVDGIAHFLSSYDGETLYLSNDSVAYRIN